MPLDTFSVIVHGFTAVERFEALECNYFRMFEGMVLKSLSGTNNNHKLEICQQTSGNN